MTITYCESERIFQLRSSGTSYLLQILPTGLVAHLYWGRALSLEAPSTLLRRYDNRCAADIREVSFEGRLDVLPQECPTFGHTDFRPPALEVHQEDGSSVSDLRYQSHRIFKGKRRLQGLPATYVECDDEAQTLELVLHDAVSDLELTLSYTCFRDHPAIARSLRVKNASARPMRLERALSFSADMKCEGWDIITLSGSWARERQYHRQNLRSGSFSIESTRGASSHQQSPFFALLDPHTTEEQGEVYGLSLVYSGNFLAQVDIDQFHTTRLLMGINPFDFAWHLEPGETFHAPEVVGIYSPSGLGAMSRAFHALYRSRLARGNFRDQERPILANNWEATYFDFDANKIESIAEVGAELGIELLVLDDGWFGKRDSDNSSLGDWKVDTRKLPNGLKDLAERVTRKGLSFGLWFEPEMVSADSDLYRAHPGWCIHVPGRHRTQLRNQYVLDITRAEVRDHIVGQICQVLQSAPIAYVKWDMNRPLTELGSTSLPKERQRELAHRYTLGVYEMMDRITSRFPHILFESCAGGGGRFDGGVLYYMPQAWTSDNMDPFERLKIQWSTSLVFPACSMGAHVCSAKNHTTGRVTPLETRGAVAMAGVFGYELDLTQLSAEERAIAKVQVGRFKELRRLVQFGDFYRLRSPYDSDEGAWMYVSSDQSEAFVVFVCLRTEPNPAARVLRLQGLDPSATYEVEGMRDDYAGDELMYAGLSLPGRLSDLQAITFRVNRTSARGDTRSAHSPLGGERVG